MYVAWQSATDNTYTDDVSPQGPKAYWQWFRGVVSRLLGEPIAPFSAIAAAVNLGEGRTELRQRSFLRL